MPEPTSVLTFSDLIVEVARKMGVAYYGVNGDEAAQVPVDPHDLDECKRHVNNAIRMFIHDAPTPNGWRWLTPTASVTVWGTINPDPLNTVTGGSFAAGVTDLTALASSFYPTMEGRTITVAGTDYLIQSYVSPTVVNVVGDASGVAAEQFTVVADGNYTLPADFGGQYIGKITYAANSNFGVGIDWHSEGHIRAWRENVSDETGDPYWAAVRPMGSVFDGRRRYELMLYPLPDEITTFEFPYVLHFNRLVNLTEVQPAPFGHDETLKAACFAVVEKDVSGATGADWQYYYKTCLPNSYRVDALSAPKKLGYFGSGHSGRGSIQYFRDYLYDRPVVPFNP